MPVSQNEMFEEQSQYGDVSAMQQLTREAPISGAPLPGQSTTNRPVAPSARPVAGPGVGAIPFTAPRDGVTYYQQLAKTWKKLAAQPGTGPAVAAMAQQARDYARVHEAGRV